MGGGRRERAAAVNSAGAACHGGCRGRQRRVSHHRIGRARRLSASPGWQIAVGAGGHRLLPPPVRPPRRVRGASSPTGGRPVDAWGDGRRDRRCLAHHPGRLVAQPRCARRLGAAPGSSALVAGDLRGPGGRADPAGDRPGRPKVRPLLRLRGGIKKHDAVRGDLAAWRHPPAGGRPAGPGRGGRHTRAATDRRRAAADTRRGARGDRRPGRAGERAGRTLPCHRRSGAACPGRQVAADASRSPAAGPRLPAGLAAGRAAHRRDAADRGGDQDTGRAPQRRSPRHRRGVAAVGAAVGHRPAAPRRHDAVLRHHRRPPGRAGSAGAAFRADRRSGDGADGHMSVVTDAPAAGPLWTGRQARWLLVALHIPTVAVGPVDVITGVVGRPGMPAMAVLAELEIGGLQIRHSLAAAQGERPRGWQWTGLALLVLVYLPMLWFVVASALMLLRGWPAAIVAAAPVVAMPVTTGVVVALVYRDSAAEAAFLAVFWLAGLLIGGGALYGSARLVRVLEELRATRAELAELAVGQERLRVSRDLHDPLGQSLSAVSLKGDLALRLLSGDPQAARAEIQGLTGVARDALRGVRAVTRDQHAVSLPAETDGAAALLRSAGVDVRVDLDLPGLPAVAEEVLAWAVREGVTNVLRHSQARTCQITAGHRDGWVWLEIVNDGVTTPAGAGSGLAGLAERARSLAGSVRAQPSDEGRFRLLVEVPQVPEEA